MKEEAQPRDFVIIISVLHHPASPISKAGCARFSILNGLQPLSRGQRAVQPPGGVSRPPLVDHNADRLVEDFAGHEIGFEPRARAQPQGNHQDAPRASGAAHRPRSAALRFRRRSRASQIVPFHLGRLSREGHADERKPKMRPRRHTDNLPSTRGGEIVSATPRCPTVYASFSRSILICQVQWPYGLAQIDGRGEGPRPRVPTCARSFGREGRESVPSSKAAFGLTHLQRGHTYRPAGGFRCVSGAAEGKRELWNATVDPG